MIDVEVWSCGGGTQSGAIAQLIKEGRLPKPDIALMVDTGRERSSTWPFLDGFIRPALACVDLELTVIPKADFATVDLFSLTGKDILLPGFTNKNNTIGKLDGYCSGEWKRDVTMRYLRSIGIQSATNWIGISLDEMRRVRTPRRKWLRLRYPLLFDVPMRRHQCIELIKAAGWKGTIPHSACWMCPNLGDAEWIDMKLHWPDDFAAACSLEKELQQSDPHFFLHGSCQPLGDVDFFAQHTLLPSMGCVGECFT